MLNSTNDSLHPKPRRALPLLGLARLAMLVCLFSASVSITKPDCWMADLATSFLLALTLVASICVVMDFYTQSWKWLTISLLSVLLSLVTLHRYINFNGLLLESLQSEVSSEPQTNFSILVANVHVRNTNYQAFVKLIQKLDPLLVVAIETDAKWQAKLDPALSTTYPFNLGETGRGAFGMRIYSKVPLINPVPLFQGRGFPLSYEFTLPIPGPSKESPPFLARTIAIHALPPINPEWGYLRNSQIETLTQYLSLTNDNTIVLGDFNAPPWSAPLSQLTSSTNLVNARDNRCLCNTWPRLLHTAEAGIPGLEPLDNIIVNRLGTPIDHVFYRGKIRLTNFETLIVKESDHLGLLAEFTTMAP